MASMPTRISSILAIALLSCLCSTGHGEETPKFHVMNIESLETSTTCSTTEDNTNATYTLKITYAYGPCSSLGANLTVDPIEVLLRDEQRVNHIHQRLSSNASYPFDSKPTANVPLRSGSSVAGSGSFVITIGLGTPPRPQTVFFDTGSNTCWVQCRPCSRSCYPQKDPLFNPLSSLSYRRIPCSSSTCSLPEHQSCGTAGNCLYGVIYADQSSSMGFLSQDDLALTTAADVIPGFVFGCSQSFTGSFGGAAGLFGLGRDPLSLVSQTSAKYGNLFSYCLPSSTSSTGYFRFGADQRDTPPFSTPMLTDRRDKTFYGVELVGISVGGQRLPISPTVFSKVGTIIDSGTTVTHLPSDAYATLRTAFRSGMSRSGYGQPMAVGNLDTCYVVTGMSSILVPAVKLFFSGGWLSLGSDNIVYRVGNSVFCLAFVGNSEPSDMSIIGNVQQKGYEIVHDLRRRRIGFASGKC